MRKFYLAFLCCLIATGLQAQDTYTVTFAVDFTGVAGVNNPSVAGNWQDDDTRLPGTGEWSAGVHNLTDMDGDSIFLITATIPGGEYQFKFLPDNTFDAAEGSGLSAACGADDGFGNFNRAVTISSDTTIAYIFNSCDVIADFTVSNRNPGTAATFTLAPNPMTATASLFIDNPANERLDMTLTDFSGRVITRMRNVGQNVELNRENLPAGLYLVTLTNEQRGSVTRKLVIR